MTPQKLLCRHVRNALIGFAFGIITIPMAAACWPFVAAALLWNDTDEETF